MKFHYMHGNPYFMSTMLASMLLLAGCGDNQVGNASEIIKKGLKSPSSFSLVSGKSVWSGKSNNGESAHVVHIEYDAQNGFGAMTRDCSLVAYTDAKDGGANFRSPGAVESCEIKGAMSEDQMIKMQVDNNFNR